MLIFTARMTHAFDSLLLQKNKLSPKFFSGFFYAQNYAQTVNLRKF